MDFLVNGGEKIKGCLRESGRVGLRYINIRIK
jgi:hypothetical protein